MLPGDVPFSNPLPVCNTELFDCLFFFTCKARKLHQYFIGGSIFLCTDSMGNEINSGVLIMQCGDTDLILCLSTCTDILMHSAPLLSGTQEVFTLFVQSREEIQTSCLTEVTSPPKSPKDINENTGATVRSVFLGRCGGLLDTLWKYISSFSQKQCEC